MIIRKKWLIDLFCCISFIYIVLSYNDIFDVWYIYLYDIDISFMIIIKICWEKLLKHHYLVDFRQDKRI